MAQNENITLEEIRDLLSGKGGTSIPVTPGEAKPVSPSNLTGAPIVVDDTAGGTTLVPVNTKKAVTLTNNGQTSVWFTLDGSVPIADTGSETVQNGDGYGTRLSPNDFFDTQVPISTAVKAIAKTGNSNGVTVCVY